MPPLHTTAPETLSDLETATLTRQPVVSSPNQASAPLYLKICKSYPTLIHLLLNPSLAMVLVLARELVQLVVLAGSSLVKLIHLVIL